MTNSKALQEASAFKNDATPVRYSKSGCKVLKIAPDGKYATVQFAELHLFSHSTPIILSYRTYERIKKAMSTNKRFFELDNGDIISLNAVERILLKERTEQSIDQARVDEVLAYKKELEEVEPCVYTTLDGRKFTIGVDIDTTMKTLEDEATERLQAQLRIRQQVMEKFELDENEYMAIVQNES